MEVDPFGGDVRRLRSTASLWRRRVGNWRIFFAVNDAGRTVDVAAIVRRATTTY
jgi:mRNA-degrading endonuclease RelE of RelBE toxin-antitoxin system